MREVRAAGSSRPLYVATYTIPEAARALGKTELTLKKWIEEGMVPEPTLHDTARNYRQYAQPELEAIAAVLVLHAVEFSYYAKNHIGTRDRIFADVSRARRRVVGG